MPATSLAVHSPALAPPPAARLLQLWHLYSLDAPTVAWAFFLLFARSAQVPHAAASAVALACAVWLIYAGDRMLDGAGLPCGSSPLHRLYRQHALRFLVAAAVCSVGCVWALRLVALPVLRGWALLAVPLALYAVAVHRHWLASRWKPLCIAVFFAAAMLVPCLAAAAVDWAVCTVAALLFGALCHRNCVLLQGGSGSVRGLAVYCAGCFALGISVPALAAVAGACCTGMVLLHLLQGERSRFSSLTFRALADAALAAPALVLLAR